MWRIERCLAEIVEGRGIIKTGAGKAAVLQGRYTLFRNSPKFEKRMHHVVPAAWQRRNSRQQGNRDHFIETLPLVKICLRRVLGTRWRRNIANIIFDEYFRPSDRLEDKLSAIESKAIQGLDQTIATSVIDKGARVDIAYLLALQACRYPEHFERRLDWPISSNRFKRLFFVSRCRDFEPSVTDYRYAAWSGHRTRRI